MTMHPPSNSILQSRAVFLASASRVLSIWWEMRSSGVSFEPHTPIIHRKEDGVKADGVRGMLGGGEEEREAVTATADDDDDG